MTSRLHHKGLALCLDATLGIKAASVGPSQCSRYTDAAKTEGRGWPKGTTDDQRLDKDTHTHLHGSGAGSLKTADLRSNDIALTTGLVTSLSQEPKRSGTNREQQEVPKEVPQEIPHENSEKHPDNTFKGITTLSLMEQGIKKLILGDCEVTAGCQVIADIVKVKDTIEELALPTNTKSSKTYQITIEGSAETVGKAKTTINNIVMYYHDEVTHPDEVHEECVVQLVTLLVRVARR